VAEPDGLDEFDEAVGFGHDLNRVANTGELHGDHNGYTFFYPRLTITDNDTASTPAVSIAAAKAVQEGDDPAATTDMVFPISLSAASGKDVTVWYSLGGIAVSGADYDTPAMSLHIPAGTTTAEVAIPVRGDTADEGAAETVEIALLGAVNAELADSGTTATGHITDDDGPPVLSVADAAAVDEGSAAAFTVSLSQLSGQDVAFSWATAVDPTAKHPATAGADYTPVAGRIAVIPAGARTAQVTVQTLDDDADEHPETFNVTLSDPEHAVLAADPTATGTIAADAADPAPTITIAGAADVAEGDDPDATTDMVFAVALSAASGKAVTVAYAVTSDTATAGADYLAPTETTLTIPAGTTAAEIAVAVKGDAEDEIHETLTVTLAGPVNAVLGDPASATGVIRDDDGAERPWVRLSIKEKSIVEGDPVTVELRASSVAKKDTDVNFYVAYQHHQGGSGRSETGAWFQDSRGVGLQIATIPAGQTRIDYTIQTRADQADRDGRIWAAMLTPGLVKTEGIRNIGNPDGTLEPYQPDWDSFEYLTGTPARDQVEVHDGPDQLSPLFSVVNETTNFVAHAGEPAKFKLLTDTAPEADTVVSYDVSATGSVVAAADQGRKQTTVPAGARTHYIIVPTHNTNSGQHRDITVRHSTNSASGARATIAGY